MPAKKPPARDVAHATSSNATSGGVAPLGHDELLEALRGLVDPIAALAVARGVPFAAVEETLKRAFVAAARTAQPDSAGQRLVSRISTVTGLNRREVTRLSQDDTPHEAPKPSHATQLFTRWLADAGSASRAAQRALPRQGPAPSFEALARSITNDVHPRSLLDELCRLGLARVDGDTVHLTHESFVPKDDTQRMLRFLASNAGDHLRAAVANVLSHESPHLEQAVFADELSQASIQQVDALMRARWKSLLSEVVPELQRLLDADRLADRPRDQRVRIGLYMYSTEIDTPPEPARKPRKN